MDLVIVFGSFDEVTNLIMGDGTKIIVQETYLVLTCASGEAIQDSL